MVKNVLAEDIDEIVDCLKSGGLVILPTETVYIAAIDPTNSEAVKKLYAYKNRPWGKPFSVAVADIDMAKEFVHLNNTAENLYRVFLPGPLTVVSQGKQKMAPGIESESGTLGIRIPDYSLILEICKQLGKPITATSANASYKRRPYKISDITDNLTDKQLALIDLVVDVGELAHNEPSTVVDATLEESVILRQGEVALKDKIEVISRNYQDTRNLGKELWQKYEQHQDQRAIIFALEGPMGVGKTQLTKGIAKAMGIEDDIVSPTYIIEAEYENKKLIHIDSWRLTSGEELRELGFSKRIVDRAVIVIEWAERVVDLIKEHNDEAIIIWVKISYGATENERLINWGVI